MLKFEPGRRYSRPDVKELAGLARSAKGGNWDTGVVEHRGEFLIFANVGAKGRTGHDYENSWEGACLLWFHKNGSLLSWHSVQRLLDAELGPHIFWRDSNDRPFEYAGRGLAVEVADTRPVRVLWSFDSAPQAFTDSNLRLPEQQEARYIEGATRRVVVNAFERDRRARQACVDRFGYSCAVCSFLFEAAYGDLGTDFIHVHHLIPLSELRDDYQVNPNEDLMPVCANCHAMIHRRVPPLTIQELRDKMSNVSIRRVPP